IHCELFCHDLGDAPARYSARAGCRCAAGDLQSGSVWVALSCFRFRRWRVWLTKAIDCRILPSQNLPARHAEPAVKQCRIHLPEIGVMAEIAVVEVREARMGADDTGANPAANKQDWGAG